MDLPGPAGSKGPWPPTSSPPAPHAWQAEEEDDDNGTTHGSHDIQHHQLHRRHQPRPTTSPSPATGSSSGGLHREQQQQQQPLEHRHRHRQQQQSPDDDDFKRPALPYRKSTTTATTTSSSSSSSSSTTTTTTMQQQQQQCGAAVAGHLLPAAVQARSAKELEALFRHLVHTFHASAPHHLRTGAPAATAADGSHGDGFAPTTSTTSTTSPLSAAAAAAAAATTTTVTTVTAAASSSSSSSSRRTHGRGHAYTSSERGIPFSPVGYRSSRAGAGAGGSATMRRYDPASTLQSAAAVAARSSGDWPPPVIATRGCDAPPRPSPAAPSPAPAAPNKEGLAGHTLDMLAQGVETTTRCTTAWSSHAFWNQQFASCRPIMKNSSSSAPSLPATTSKTTTKPSNGAGWNSPGRYDLLLHAAASHGLRSPAPSSGAAAAAASADAARALRKRKREEEATEDDEEEPIVITMAPAAAQLRAGAATASGQAVITIPRTYTHETASNLFVFAELTGARKRDIALSFDEGTLRLMASRQPSLAPASDGEGGWEEGANYMVTMPLPPWVDDRRMRCVKITFSTGLLELCIPKDLAHHDEEEYPVAAVAAGAPPINAVVTVSGIGAGLTSGGREQRWRPSGHQVDQATLTAAEPAAGFLFPAHAASAYAEAVGHSTPPTERRVH